jgi:hypothetical protein
MQRTSNFLRSLKLRPLVAAIALGVVLTAHSQSPTNSNPFAATNQTRKAKDPNMNPDGSVTLSAGTLEAVVAEIERRAAYWTPSADGSKPALPNVLFGGDTRRALIPGDLRLRGVSPVQALALAAAAADCTLEAIFAPEERAELKPQIIGYRIVPEAGPARKPSHADLQRAELEQQLSTLGRSLAPNHPKMVSVRNHLSNLYSKDQAEEFAGGGIVLDVKPDLPSVSAVKPRAADPFSGGAGRDYGSETKPGGTMETDPAKESMPLVQIYALGPILTGNDRERAEQMEQIHGLIESALQLAGRDPLTPKNIAIHSQSKALVVRAPAAQHAIIAQAIAALKENGTASESAKQP